MIERVLLIYGVKSLLSGGFIVESGEVKRDTPKQVILKERMASYGYRKLLSKQNDRIAYTPQKAVRYFIQRKRTQIERLQYDIDELNLEIDQAQRLLDD